MCVICVQINKICYYCTKMTSKTIYNTNCCVFNCHSRKNSNRNVHFHYFPPSGASRVNIINNFGVTESVDRRKAWEKALLMGKKVTKNMRVCSLHFQDNDYLAKGVALSTLKRPKLKSCAVPSRNLPKLSQMKKVISRDRRSRWERRNLFKRHVKPVSSVTESCQNECYTDVEKTQEESIAFENLTSDEQLVVHSLLEMHNSVSVQSEKKLNKSVQVTSGDIVISFSSTIKTDMQLNSLTGISTFTLLNDLVELIKEMYPDKKIHKVTVKDRVIVVFMKLKMAIKFNILAFLFKVCPATIRLIFNEYTSYLANILRGCIYWPSTEAVAQNLPLCFANFSSVKVVLDCTEIPIQKPKCLSCRIRTYSHYKSGQTIKCMLGVSPAGLVTFVSRCYGGRCSDKIIFEQSEIIKKLEPHVDSVMVDKGFLIEDICHKRCVKLVRPTFLRDKKQFSKTEAHFNLLISRARVHVERVNQRLKIFEILRVPLPWSLVNKIDDIFVIISAIVNLQAPVLQDDKF